MSFDWAGGGLVSTAGDLSRFAAGLFGGELVSPGGVRDLTRWEPRAYFDPGGTASSDRYGLGVGAIEAGGFELVGATGVWGAFMFWIPAWQVAVGGTINQARVSRRPLLSALVEALRTALPAG